MTQDTDSSKDGLAAKIVIKTESSWLANHQVKSQGKYAFSYHITIINHCPKTVQLLNRYWLITDGNGKQTEVAGPGVIGETPILATGEKFSYTSGAILDTPLGFMQGHYEFIANDKFKFNAPIEVFTLSVPNTVN